MNEIHILNYLSAIGVYYTQLGKNSILVAETERFPLKDFMVNPTTDEWSWGDKGLHGRSAYDFVDICEQGSGGDDTKIKERLREVMDDNIDDPEYGITIPQLGRPDAVIPKNILSSVSSGIFRLPPKSFNGNMMDDYLAKDRLISKSVSDYFVNTKQLYEASEEILNAEGKLLGYDHSLVFCRKDDFGEIKCGVKKSLNTGKYTDVPNSDKDASLFTFPDHIKEDADEIILFESEIDLLSYLSLLAATGRDWRFYVGVALGGVTPNMWVSTALGKLLRKLPRLKTIRISFDNNEKGQQGAASLALHIREYYKENGMDDVDIPNITALHPGVSSLSYHLNTEIKDWNDALKLYCERQADEADYSKVDLKATFEADKHTKEGDEASSDSKEREEDEANDENKGH